MSSKEKKEQLLMVKEQKKVKLEQAARSFHAGEHANLRQAALSYGVNYNTLYHGIVKRGGEFRGSGNFTSRLTRDEEKKSKTM